MFALQKKVDCYICGVRKDEEEGMILIGFYEERIRYVCSECNELDINYDDMEDVEFGRFIMAERNAHC